MIDRLLDIVNNREFGPALLQGALVIILLFIFFLIPSFEPGPDLAAFLATLAIVILSVLSAHYSEKRTELLQEQQELIEYQTQMLERVEEQTREQTDLVEDLNSNLEDSESDSDEGEVKKKNKRLKKKPQIENSVSYPAASTGSNADFNRATA